MANQANHLPPPTTAIPPSPPPSPPPPSMISVCDLPADCLQLIASRLHSERTLLPFALTCKGFDAARRRDALPLKTNGQLFVRRLRLLEWAVGHVAWLDQDYHRRHGCVWAAELGCLPAILWLVRAAPNRPSPAQ